MAKLILTHEVTGLGNPGDVVEVRDGYARNYLLPRGFATVWSKGGEGEINAIRRARRAREVASLEAAQALRDQLNAATVVVEVSATESGRLFGSVSTAEIAEAAAKQGLAIDRRKVQVETPIKALGEHQVKVSLHPEVQAKLAVSVRKA